jgi:TonB family protein
MDGEGRDFTVNLAFSVVLHFLVFAGVFLTPSLSAQRFHMPVAYKVTLVELPGGERPAEAALPKTAPPAPQSTPAPQAKASEAKPQVAPPSPETLAVPKKPERTEKRPRAATGPSAVVQAPVPAAVPTGRAGTGTPGIVAESSVSTEKADPSLSYYLAAIQAKVSGRWVEPSVGLAAGQVERVTVGFTVVRSGLVRDIQLVSVSRNVFLDQSALRAVQEAVPLPPFPPLYSEETIAVRFHFEMRGQ